jgi:hypothetical protein
MSDMPEDKIPSKEQLLKKIEELKKNPHDKFQILSDIGIGAVGAVGAGAAAFAFGGTTASVLFGLVAIPVAAPFGVVAGAAVLGGAAFVGAKRVLFDGTYNEGKTAEIRKQLEERFKEIEAKERRASLEEKDKTEFITFLEEPLKANLISAKDAYRLIMAIENGQMSLQEAYRLVKNIIDSAKQ